MHVRGLRKQVIVMGRVAEFPCLGQGLCKKDMFRVAQGRIVLVSMGRHNVKWHSSKIKTGMA